MLSVLDHPKKTLAQKKGFNVFDGQELVVGIAVSGGASMTRKEIDGWIEWVKRPQIGANGLVWVKYNEDGSFTNSFFTLLQLGLQKLKPM